ncbi:MAG: CDP-archaeol synthase [Planctomycetota bacterium]|nr:CDP-archaeol synthase [Planctomycetota bacterium]
MTLISDIGRVCFLASPVIIAGVLHMILAKLNVLSVLKVPLDRGKEWREKRIFGDNKTWRGVVLMIVLTMAAYEIQTWSYRASDFVRGLAYYDYDAVNSYFAGFMLGLGYILAELPNSFVKRRLDIKAGKGDKGLKGKIFMVVDQGDSVLGCLLAMYAYWSPSAYVFFLTLATGTGIHLLVNGLLNLAKLKGGSKDEDNEGEKAP